MLERDLLAAGEQAVRVPPKLMALTRRAERTYGKSDPVDALAVARAALAAPDLPPATVTEETLTPLVDYRRALVEERTRMQNRLHWRLHRWDPELAASCGSLSSMRALTNLARRLHRRRLEPPARVARGLVRHIRMLTREIEELERELAASMADEHPALLAIPGCGVLTAATIVSATNGVARFPTFPQYAMYAGKTRREAIRALKVRMAKLEAAAT